MTTIGVPTAVAEIDSRTTAGSTSVYVCPANQSAVLNLWVRFQCNTFSSGNINMNVVISGKTVIARTLTSVSTEDVTLIQVTMGPLQDLAIEYTPTGTNTGSFQLHVSGASFLS